MAGGIRLPLLGFLFWPWIPTQRGSFEGGGEGWVLRYLGDGVAGDGRDLQFVRGVGAAHCGGGRAIVARPCQCRVARRAARMLEQAKIPRRYEECTLENFEPKYDGADRSLQWRWCRRADS